jgi:hypothetical protein
VAGRACVSRQLADRRRRIGESKRIEELTPPHEIPANFQQRGGVANLGPTFLNRLGAIQVVDLMGLFLVGESTKKLNEDLEALRHDAAVDHQTG